MSSEAALRGSEAQLRVLAEVMPNHVWTARPDGLFDWFNEQVYMYSGEREGDSMETDGSRSFIPTTYRSPLSAGRRRSHRARTMRLNSDCAATMANTDGISPVPSHCSTGKARSCAGLALTQTLTIRSTPKGFLNGGWRSGPPSGTGFGGSVRTCWAWPTVKASGSVLTRPGPDFWAGPRENCWDEPAIGSCILKTAKRPAPKSRV